MELFWKDTAEGWRLFYTDKAAMDADEECCQFLAQAKDTEVMNFWGTIRINVAPGCNVQEVVRRMLDMEHEIRGELA